MATLKVGDVVLFSKIEGISNGILRLPSNEGWEVLCSVRVQNKANFKSVTEELVSTVPFIYCGDYNTIHTFIATEGNNKIIDKIYVAYNMDDVSQDSFKSIGRELNMKVFSPVGFNIDKKIEDVVKEKFVFENDQFLKKSYDVLYKSVKVVEPKSPEKILCSCGKPILSKHINPALIMLSRSKRIFKALFGEHPANESKLFKLGFTCEADSTEYVVPVLKNGEYGAYQPVSMGWLADEG